MSGILFLNHNDFEVKKGDRGDMMTLKYEKHGLTLVLFYSKELPSCEYLMIRFKQLPGLINGCNFAMVNMNKNMELVNMSRNTIAPITYVPDLTLFVNGCPFIRYDGEQEIEAIRKFLEDIYEKIKKLQFTNTASSAPAHHPNRAAAMRPDQVEFNTPSPSSYGHTNTTSSMNQNQFYPQSAPPLATNPINYQNGSSQYMQQPQSSALGHPMTPAQFDRTFPQQGSQNPQQSIRVQDGYVSEKTRQPAIPAYTVGVPKSSDPKRSYKTFDSAYTTITHA